MNDRLRVMYLSPAAHVGLCKPQVLNHAWHIPIRGAQDGEQSTKWLCINLAPLVDEDRGGGQTGVRPSEIRPRRKYRS